MLAVRLLPLGLVLLLALQLSAQAKENDLVSPAIATASPGLILGVGERMIFQASWKFFSRAGRINVFADDQAADGEKPVLPVTRTPPRRIRVDVCSDGVIACLYKYHAAGESFFDPVTGQMLYAKYQSNTGSKREDRSITFDLEKRLAHYRDSLVPKRDADIPLPPGDPLDLITCLVTARRWNLQPGDTRDIVVLADKRFYPLRLRALRRESIKAPLGSFDSLLVVPEPIGPATGMFRKGGAMRIWIEDTPRALPLRVEVKVPFGTVTADLVEYQPPLALAETAAGATLRAGD